MNFPSNGQGCNVDDYKALRTLYLSTNGDEWTNKDNWNIKTETPPFNCNLSSFKGVYLNSNGRVNLISLGKNNLTGQLPPEIKNLKFLHTLWLENNSITGAIPREIGELELLERIALSYNNLKGALPQELFNIRNLQELSLESNKIEGTIPSQIGSLLSLKRLDLSYNNLSGFLPKEIGDLKNIESININNNKLEGCFPQSFKSLCSKIVNFSNNILLANWSAFCKNPSECIFDYKFKGVSFSTDTLFVSESPNKRQFIFISEGFTKNEFQKFRSFVIQITSKLKEHFPNISFEALIAYVPSNESGVSNLKAVPAIKKDTYFETEIVTNVFGNPGIVIKEQIACPFMNFYFPENKYPLAQRIPVYIVNSDIYGGYAYVGTNSCLGIELNIGVDKDAEWVFAHELGHVFGLADINDNNYTKQEWPNITQEKDKSKIKWRTFIKESTPIPTPRNNIYDDEIGLFPIIDGNTGKESGWFRPCNNKCIMDSPSSHLSFCKVCGNHLDKNDKLPFVKIT